ncbi:GspE/PulE family protein [Vibrio sp. D431a]|uniref:GspE/PulE family protein n=1 Tax=Vibrio sp. D431a TaxID=2837388 RepID=UPI00255224E3|nr:ATPase, T2SS/T4P/T4SS family [Vibrio sp. D431a]MDK9793852.1 Flp pilus assembly complex ATPase component TadA [Vibrio sp. D431a]
MRKRKDINSVADLGEDWILMGVENGDCKVLKLSPKDQKFAMFIHARVKNNGVDEEVVYVLGHKRWLSSANGSTAIDKIQKAKLDRHTQPVKDRSLMIEIKKEFDSRVKEGNVAVQKEEVEVFENVTEVEDEIVQSLRDGVSDIHLEVRESTARIRRRINGQLKVSRELGAKKGVSWGRTIYNVLTTVSAPYFKPEIPQDALIDKDFGFVRLRGRVATAPASPSGFTMVIRLLRIQNATRPLTTEEMGYAKRERSRLGIAISKPSGLFLVSGTTGSGKSTTLQNILMGKILERNGEIAVITVEDPPEYFIPAATQIPVVRDDDGDASKSFESSIRTSLRMDPDLIMIGEIRDRQSGKLAQQAVESGHPVLSTLHSAGAVESVSRLESLGVDRHTLSTPKFIAGLFYQKLLPKVCPSCARTIVNGRVPNRLSERDLLVTLNLMGMESVKSNYGRYKEMNTRGSFIRYLQDIRLINSEQADIVAESYHRFNNPDELSGLYDRIASVSDIKNDSILFKGDGCPECKFSGISGRSVASEGLVPDMNALEMIQKGADRELMVYWKKNMDGKTALEDAVEKMRLGLFDPYEIEAELDLIGSSII